MQINFTAVFSSVSVGEYFLNIDMTYLIFYCIIVVLCKQMRENLIICLKSKG
jgi:hypothetical protein